MGAAPTFVSLASPSLPPPQMAGKNCKAGNADDIRKFSLCNKSGILHLNVEMTVSLSVTRVKAGTFAIPQGFSVNELHLNT